MGKSSLSSVPAVEGLKMIAQCRKVSALGYLLGSLALPNTFEDSLPDVAPRSLNDEAQGRKLSALGFDL